MLTVSGATRSRWVPGGGYFVKRFLKWAGGVILVLVLLLALAAAGIRYFLSSEQLIEIVQARGEETLGRKVRLRSLSVGLFSLEAEGLSVGGGKEEGGGKKTPLIEVEEIDILFDPTALAYNRLNLLQVELRGVWVRASRDAGGRFSFQDIIDRLGAAGAGRVFLPPDKTGVASSSIFSPRTAEAAEEGAAQGMGGDDFDVVIRSLEIEDAKLFFESAAFNGQPAFRLSCVFERVEAGTLRVGSPIEAGLQGRCAEPGDLLLQADLRADLPGRSFSVSAKFDVSEIEPFARLAPAAESFRALRGVVKGKADLSYSPEAVARWSIDLAADNLSGELRLIPGGGWRPLRPSKAALRSEGSYDLRNEAAEISRLEVDLPFLKARMPKGGGWNLSGRDEVEVNLEMPDLGEVLRIAAPLLGFSAKGFKEGAKVELVASASREREKGPDFFYSVSAAFDPVNLAPIARLAYPIEGIRGLGGRVGGKVQLSFSPEEVARWEVDVAGKSLSGQLRLRPRERWRRVRLAEVSVRSAGSYDLRRDTGEVSRLEVDLPFGAVRLPEGGRWNVGGRDEAGFSITVSDIGSALAAAAPIMGISADGVKKGGKFEASASVGRDRGKNRISYSVAARLDSLDLGALARIAPMGKSARNLKGVLGGSLEFSATQEELLRWKADLSAAGLSADLRVDSQNGWRKVGLAKAAVRTEGSYDIPRNAARFEKLDADLPFGKIRLKKGARWNVEGRDEGSFTVSLSDLGAAVAAAGPFIGVSPKEFKRGGKLDASLTARRDRKRKALSCALTARFDPVEIGPFARLAPRLNAARNLSGRFGGKIELSTAPDNVFRWKADLTGTGVSGDFRGGAGDGWRSVKLAKMALRSAGRFDAVRGSARLSRLEAEFPFGSLRLPKGGSWNVSGRDEAEIDLAVSNLASAFSALGPVMGPVAGGLRPQGTLQASLSIRRDRKPAKVSILGTAETNLKRVHLTDYPNLEIRGSGKVAFGKRGAQVSLPRLSAHDRRRPEAAPALRLEAVSATLSQQGLMEGRITSREVRVRSMSFRGSMDPAGKSTLDGLLEKRRKAAKKSAPARPGSAGPGPPSAGKAAKPSPGSSKPPPAGAGGRRAPLPAERPVTEFPEVKIGKVEIDNLDVNFRHEVEKGKPPVIVDWKGLRFSAKNIDTRMPAQRRDTRVHLYQPPKGDSKVFPLDLQARMNLGVIPLSVKGNFNLRQFDLRPFSPYARKAQKIEIRRGTLELDSEFNIRRNYIIATADAVVFGLALKSIGKNDPRKAVRLLALNFPKKEKGEIPVRVRVEGRLDDPSFNLAEAAVASLLVNVVDTVLDLAGKTQNLGGSVADILKGVLGGTLGGAGSGGITEKEQSAPAPRTGKSPEKALKELGKELEKEFKNTLKGLFGR